MKFTLTFRSMNGAVMCATNIFRSNDTLKVDPRGAALRRKLISVGLRHGWELGAYSLEPLRSQMSCCCEYDLQTSSLLHPFICLFPGTRLIFVLCL